jgi:hypothetical protein
VTGKIVVQDQLGQIVHKTAISKITRAKLTGGMAQAIYCQHETLSSNLILTKKRRGGEGIMGFK